MTLLLNNWRGHFRWPLNRTLYLLGVAANPENQRCLRGAGSSHGLSFRVARGLYYRPSTFRGRVIEKEETVHQDTGLFGFTTKHIYFSGPKKKCRVRSDKFVDFEPYDDGFGIMKDSQTAKPPSRRRPGPATVGWLTT